MRSYSAWKRRPESCLAALQSRRCNWRTLSVDSRPLGWLDLAVMPSCVLAQPTLPPQGPFVPRALFVARLVTTTVPSDARCTRFASADGLYNPLCRDAGGADGPLVFRSSPCPRAAPPPPPRPATRAPPDWGIADMAFAAT